jgi:ATP-dependent exoDNAse (exonuclease V) alpha subunit/predicted SprT family Zn-dependent metalloprotease
VTDLTQNRLKALIEAARNRALAQPQAPAVAGSVAPAADQVAQTVQEVIKQATESSAVSIPIQEATLTLKDGTKLVPAYDEPEDGSFLWNPEQQQAIAQAREGKSFNLIGAAGTGKTTTEKEIARMLVEENRIPSISFNTKYLKRGLPGIVFTSFTRRAVRNMRRVVSPDLAAHCITLHKLLEYEPQFYEVWDDEEQKMRKTMRFEPTRNHLNKLPDTLKCIVIDESSMVSVELFLQLLKALPNPNAVQFIFVGDLHQLPPVYGQAILGFKLLELPTVELVRIYRQAKKSPIITLAHKIKNGEDCPLLQQTITETEQGKVTLHPWKKQISDFDGMVVASAFLKKLILSGNYDEEEDIILCPQEKIKNLAFGTNEFNRVIAQTLGEKREAVVFEIVAGYEKHYYAVGDRLLVGREDATITKITRNAKFWGKRPRPASKELDRWGNYKKIVKEESTDPADDFDADNYLDQFTLEADKKDEDRKQEASHVIEVQLLDTGATEALGSAGEINAAQFAYALTVHKSQGSEWNRVFFITHQSHVAMWNRELLYTAVTRARKELYIICEPDRGAKPGTLTKAARSPRIKGDTLAEKAEFFKGKKDDYQNKLDEVDKLDHADGPGREGVYKGNYVPAAPIMPKSDLPPVKIVRLEDLVPIQFKKEAQEELDACWQRAELIWGKEKIGIKPGLQFNLQRSNIIGLAAYGENVVKLNPLWCILADENEKLRFKMIKDTIPHEIAHFINHRYSVPKGKGHDGGWVMAAKLMGMPNPQETTSEFPTWAEGWKALAARKKQELGVEKDGIKADTSDDVETIWDAEA